jgi:phage gpG-like protein
MTDNAKTARLWMGFHHLSERQKSMSIAITEQITKSLQSSQYAEMESVQGKNRQYAGIETFGDEPNGD